MSDSELEHGRAGLSPDDVANLAVATLREDSHRLPDRLDGLPAPIFVTDADGWVTYFNRACVDFTGRIPVPGQDRWCVTWRLYTESGAFLPHQDCPMAVALREQRPVRNVIAVAERPDGSRVMFLPYPSPITDDEGVLIGAVNVIVAVTDRRQAAALEAQATRCRRLAGSMTDPRTVFTLTRMAEDYEERARQLTA